MSQNKIKARFLILSLLVVLCSNKLHANDSLILGQAFVNLTLTSEYFDSIDGIRLNKILNFEKNELESVQKTSLTHLHDYTFSLWNYINSKYTNKNSTNPDRRDLIEWHNYLDIAIEKFNQSIDRNQNFYTSYYKFIEFTDTSYFDLYKNIKHLKKTYNPIFNRAIYFDFKRVMQYALENNVYYFDSLKHYSDLFDIPIASDLYNSFGNNQYINDYWYSYEHISNDYHTALALQLIVRYMQLNDIISNKKKVNDVTNLYCAYEEFINYLQPDSNHFFFRDGIIEKDAFFEKYLNKETCNSLYSLLKQNYPIDEYYLNKDADAIVDFKEQEIDVNQRYYFPTPAPLPTAKIAIKHFKPQLKTLKEVDEHIKKSFNKAGYQGRLHYYYITDPGFAVSTNIERINKDGSPAEGAKRWDLSAGTSEELSLYNIFKLMFFKTESDYRMIVCIVSAKEIQTTTATMSIGMASDLMRNSYSSLPKDLENLVLKDKTITVLLYHYTQDDVGKVPALNSNTILTVYDHLQKTPTLTGIIEN